MEEILPDIHHTTCTQINSTPHVKAHFFIQPLERHGKQHLPRWGHSAPDSTESYLPCPRPTSFFQFPQRQGIFLLAGAALFPFLAPGKHFLTKTLLQCGDSKEFVFCLCFSAYPVAFIHGSRQMQEQPNTWDINRTTLALVVSILTDLWNPVPPIPLVCGAGEHKS